MIEIALLARVVQVDVLTLPGTVVKWWINPSDLPLLSNTFSQKFNVLLAFRSIACLSILHESVYCWSLWSQMQSPVTLDRSNPMGQLLIVIFDNKVLNLLTYCWGKAVVGRNASLVSQNSFCWYSFLLSQMRLFLTCFEYELNVLWCELTLELLNLPDQ